MISPNEIRRAMSQLDILHREDGDGGYDLVRALLDYRRGLTGEEQVVFRQVALEVIREQRYGLWSVVLEALVQAGDAAVVHELAELLRTAKLGAETEDYIIQALLRFSYEGVDYKSYLQRALAEKRGMAIPNLAALVRVDRSLCIEIACQHMNTQLRAGREAEVEACLPPFVENFLEIDESLIVTLVSRVAVAERSHGRTLALLFKDYLMKPWIIRRLGEAQAKRLAMEVTKAAS